MRPLVVRNKVSATLPSHAIAAPGRESKLRIHTRSGAEATTT